MHRYNTVAEIHQPPRDLSDSPIGRNFPPNVLVKPAFKGGHRPVGSAGWAPLVQPDAVDYELDDNDANNMDDDDELFCSPMSLTPDLNRSPDSTGARRGRDEADRTGSSSRPSEDISFVTAGEDENANVDTIIGRMPASHSLSTIVSSAAADSDLTFHRRRLPDEPTSDANIDIYKPNPTPSTIDSQQLSTLDVNRAPAGVRSPSPRRHKHQHQHQRRYADVVANEPS